MILDALKQNKSIVNIHLSGCEISEQILGDIEACLRSNSKLHSDGGNPQQTQSSRMGETIPMPHPDRFAHIGGVTEEKIRVS